MQCVGGGYLLLRRLCVNVCLHPKTHSRTWWLAWRISSLACLCKEWNKQKSMFKLLSQASQFGSFPHQLCGITVDRRGLTHHRNKLMSTQIVFFGLVWFIFPLPLDTLLIKTARLTLTPDSVLRSLNMSIIHLKQESLTLILGVNDCLWDHYCCAGKKNTSFNHLHQFVSFVDDL